LNIIQNRKMERRAFLWQTSLLAASGILAPAQTMALDPSDGMAGQAPLAPILVPAQVPLDPKGGMDIRVRVRSGMTNGLFSSVECAVAPKKMGPAPHHHLELDELMLVLEGTASVLVGDEVVTVAAGGWHLRPRLLKHTFWNASAQPLRFIDMYFNQPFEEYLEKIFHELTPEKGFPEGSEAKKKEIEALTQKFGVVHTATAHAERAAIIKQYGLT
jgi:mannose-6-phosphate isomerase-like protein (cupin superfamily)